MINGWKEILSSAAYQREALARAEAVADYHYRMAVEEMRSGSVRRDAEEGQIIEGTARRAKPQPRLTS